MKIVDKFYSLDWKWQALILCIILICSNSITGSVTGWWKDRKSDRALKIEAAKREILETQRDAAIQKAVKAEAQAQVYEALVSKKKEKLTEAELAVGQQEEKIEEVRRGMQAEIDAISTDDGLTPTERAERNRQLLRDLGY